LRVVCKLGAGIDGESGEADRDSPEKIVMVHVAASKGGRQGDRDYSWKFEIG
jgi:hypothetical protein